MTPAERVFLLYGWNGLAVFVSLYYLGSGFAKALIIALFMSISCLLGFGQRWLMRGGFAIAIVAVAVALGFPSPDHWSDIAKSFPGTLSDARAYVSLFYNQ